MRNHSRKMSASAEQENKNSFHRQTSRSCSTVVVTLDGGSKRVSFEQRQELVMRLPVKSERSATKGTQTDYRESESQTLPWKHEVKAAGNTLQQQLLSLDRLSLEKNFPLEMDEVRLIEATRQQLAWEDVMKRLRGAENEGRRRSLMLKTTAAQAELRERRKEEENRERIEISRRDMKEAREALEEKLQLRLHRSYRCRRLENDSKIDYWHHQLTRKLRKMKSARSRPVAKPDIIDIHKDKASDLYAPKLRHGYNPSLGHEVIDIQCRHLKRFHGLEILEKHLSALSQPKLSKPRRDVSQTDRRELCPRRFRHKALAKPSEVKVEGISVKVPVAPGGSTPMVQNPLSDSEENLGQASLLLQRVIRGRAVQTDKFVELFKMMSTRGEGGGRGMGKGLLGESLSRNVGGSFRPAQGDL